MLEEFTAPVDVTIRRCVREDLPKLEWFGLFSEHREIIRSAYERQEQGENVMLVAEANGCPVGQVWIDLARKRAEDTAVLWAVRVFPALQRSGIGARLVAAAERIVGRSGVAHVELGVERTNPDAKRFYENLGYRPVASAREEYRYTTPEGVPMRVPVDQWVLRKRLTSPAGTRDRDDRRRKARG